MAMKAQKETLGVVIITNRYRIVGLVHIYENSRLSDMLNIDTNKKDFIPVTQCKVYNHDEKLLFTKDFISINRQYIEAIFIDDSSLGVVKDLIKQGHGFLSTQKYDDAIEVGKRAVSINPMDPEAHYMLGLAYAKKNLRSEAWDEFKQASNHAPKNSEIEVMAMEMLSRIKVG